ncbi:hypothetical protein BU24DRAFT_420739 [Aaosphaeria arxii CBS 175.79]|uniref:Uncharacterized protein n=1 Tax=Aaosphaeria arxii CBS 175.79 TaxID=1450172 RepID=A0A6A5XXL0_9PLEO|nr:uncharacterized protein BU24DRAFT_420739 [Aaosphaeria arxii CBS 175.79]KAF2017689.1 hypothetical protein BU24DRAFT_420739 [Aaosphaeria arxii CBS 175.79]
MPSSTMRTAVLQATVVCTISMIISHHTTGSVFDEVWENEGFRNFTDTMDQADPSIAGRPGRLKLGASNSTNAVNNGTMADEPLEAFYTVVFPRDVILNTIILMLQYYWYTWLERMLPARPRRIEAYYGRTEKIEESDDREEEVVKKWIAQGRVKRASLNWCNTFLKWIIELTIGRLWLYTVSHFLGGLLRMESPRKILETFTTRIFFDFIASFISTGPLCDLIAFIIIPAPKQIVFMASWTLVTSIFITFIIRTVASWAVKTDLAQSFMKNATDERVRQGFGARPEIQRIGDEL